MVKYGHIATIDYGSYPLRMRLRVRELLTRRQMTPYKLAVLSEGRISLSTLYRILRADGYASTFESKLLDAICDVLGVEPGELLERGSSTKKRQRR